MILAYQQHLDPLHEVLQGSPTLSALLSTLLAGLPVLVLFWLLVPCRWLAPEAGAAGAVAAIVVAIVVYQMPPLAAGMAFLNGVAFGLLPVGWTIFNAMLLYNITVETGHFAVVRRSVAGLSGDARVQAILIGFAFGAFLEGAAGGGTPVAICGAILVGLGFDPFLAAVLCLVANTSPVAYGGLGTPLITLTGVTNLPTETLSIMAGHQLPILSFLIPLYMVRCMCGWRQTWEVWPALLVSGGSFAVFQFTFATIHAYLPGVVLYPMTDIGGGIFSLVLTAIFLRYWRPRREWHFDRQSVRKKWGQDPCIKGPVPISSGRSKPEPPPLTQLNKEERKVVDKDPHAAAAVEAAAALGIGQPEQEAPLTVGGVALGWAPYALMSLFLLLTGLVRQMEDPRKVVDGRGPVAVGPVRTNYMIPVPFLHKEVYRDPRVQEHPEKARPESAEFNFGWLTAPGTAVLIAALASMAMLRMSWGQIRRSVLRTCYQMKIPIPTIACMLGLSYVTRYAGMDATLGVAFASTGLLYPFFAAILGWLGVFLTGTDAGSNALFGSLQKITATEVHRSGAFAHLSLDQAQVLICTANSTGGVMGKMIDAQSICVATAATHQIGREADIFKAVVWHSIFLAAVVGAMTLLQAYVLPFTRMVP